MYREKITPKLGQAKNFGRLLCRKVYDNGWEAQNEQQLRARIFRKIREVDLNNLNIVQRKMRQVLTKLRAIEDHVPLSLFVNGGKQNVNGAKAKIELFPKERRTVSGFKKFKFKQELPIPKVTIRPGSSKRRSKDTIVQSGVYREGKISANASKG
ncbi:hypothetical protein NQ317_000232 [Molorchus minor]|uniref:Uncharacterized protein n=1 Tax=Molorchus minor TaxID=1323400 RepID=A0ABQ9JVR4_9CUCU|nr:hypothetical protein NQ317_000232 [Molorchus minor]